MRYYIFALLLIIQLSSFSQGTYKPVCYWTFNQSDIKTDSMKSEKGLKIAGDVQTIKGRVGKGIELKGNTQLLNDQNAFYEKGKDIQKHFSYELWFKYHISVKNLGIICIAEQEMFRIQFQRDKLYFTTYTRNDELKQKTSHTLRIPFGGADRASLQYYMDDDWHHLVATFDSQTGKKEIWIDGECPKSFQVQIDSLKKELSHSGRNAALDLDAYSKQRPNIFCYDEVAVYDQALPASLIKKHYNEGLQGKAYSFVNQGNVTFRPAPVEFDDTAKIDIKDFVPENASSNAHEQLASYPLPRYKLHHVLMRNFNWMDISFMAGNTNGLKGEQLETNKLSLNFELAKNWHYYMVLSPNTKVREETNFIKQANENPWFPIAVNTFWIQTVPQALYPEKGKRPYIFPRNKNMQLSNKQWNPAMNVDSVRADGRTQNFYLKKRLDLLTRPIDIINENGEVFTYIQRDTFLASFPEVVKDKKRFMPNKSWYDYQSYKVYYWDSTYKYEMFNDPRLKNTLFTEYQIEGEHKQWRFAYEYRKKINDKMRGYHYSTMDIYPMYHSKWYESTGPWHGWMWLAECRRIEIAQGDRLFSPFVAAGWKSEEIKNLRPGRWLGMLKAMSLAGAEFFYVGFFNEKAPFPLPKNYTWQIAMPSYAQAASSHYQDILLKGDLLEGDIPSTQTNELLYHYWTGNLQHLVVVRKYQNRYAITGSIQPLSVVPGNVPEKEVVTIQLEGKPMTFEIRQQGSTYIYDNSNPNAPIFYQVDKWHENAHPSWWSKGFRLEAEVFDTTMQGTVAIATENINSSKGDFSNFTSYVSGTAKVGYRFQTRNIPEHKNLKLKIRARVKDGGTANLAATLDENITDYKQANNYTGKQFQTNTFAIKGKEWKWYEIDSKNQPVVYKNLSSEEAAMLWLKSENAKIEIDEIVIEP